MNPLELLDQINTLDLHFRTLFFNQVPLDTTEYGLKPTMARCLIVLYFNPGSPMHEIALKLDIEKGSLTPIAKKLEHLGLIQRTVHEKDSRVHVMKLSASGNKQAKIILQAYLDHIQTVFNGISEDVQEELSQSLRTLNTSLDKLSATRGKI